MTNVKNLKRKTLSVIYLLLVLCNQTIYANVTDKDSINEEIFIGSTILLTISFVLLFFCFNKQKKIAKKQAINSQKELQTLSDKKKEYERQLSVLSENKRELEQLLVSKIKENEAVLREATEKEEKSRLQIEQAETIQDSFFAETIHEMRTPLSLVQGSLSLVIQNNNLQEEITTQLLSAYRNTLAMQDLAEQLIGTRSPHEIISYMHVACYDIVDITRQTCDLFIDWFTMNNVDFHIISQERSIMVWIDRRKMEYALRTLLGNALKNTFMYGKIRLEIAVENHNNTPYCTLSIQDEGLDESKNTRRGLKHIEDMAESLGAMFRKTTTPNGTTFLLFIPLGKEHLQDKQIEFVEQEKDLIKLTNKQKNEIAEQIQFIPQKKVTGKKLLIIDDNDQIRWFLRHVFSKEYQILEACDGESGILAAQKGKPDLILCDVVMPVKDGYTACREIKKNIKTAQIPVVMLTAKVESEDVLKGIEAGADDYITKPFEVEILRSKINSILRRREELKHFYSRSFTITQPSFTRNNSEEEEENTKNPIPGNSFMEAVIKNIEKHLDDSTFEAKILANSLNMSLPTLYRKINQFSDCSILELTRSIRLKKAAELILKQEYSIQEICEMVGFNDTGTFRKRFTEQYGVTPSQYGQVIQK